MVVLGAAGVEGLTLLEGVTADDEAALEGTTGTTLDCVGGAGGADVAVLTGRLLRGTVAVDSTEVTGGAGGGASYDGTTGGV